MAINQQLLQPEQGWKRIDDTDSNIEYIGNWKPYDNSGLWGGSSKYTNDKNSSIRFSFTGSKIRIISEVSSIDKRDDNIILIDGNEYKFSESYSPTRFRIVVFEKIDLHNGNHYVEIKPSPSVEETTGYGINMVLYAVDINENEKLMKYQVDKYLIQQSKNIYSIDHNYINLGESKSPTELSYWIENYGYNDLNIINESLDNKHTPTVVDDDMIYESLNIDFNDVKKPNIYVFEEDDKKKVRYDTDSYKIIDEIKKINSGIGNVVFKEY
ncbi:MAG: hypothetical protein AB2417_15750 [Clostridiaceae bacterium]